MGSQLAKGPREGAECLPVILTAAQKASLQARTLIILFLGTVGARAASTLTFTVASLAVLEMLDNDKLAGLPTVAVTLGTAISSRLLSNYMAGRGRRPGLTLGFGIAAGGLALTAYGVNRGSLVLFAIGLLFFGVGQGSANLARYAAADLALPSNRGKAISFIVFASTIGAVGGPLLIAPAERLASSYDNGKIIGPYGVGALCMIAAALIIQAGLRPDPLEASGGLDAHSPERSARATMLESLSLIRANPLAKLALVGMIVSQLVMVMVMVMTPAHMKVNGHDQAAVGWVISVHTAGMFMFAPIAGWVSDRFGRAKTIMQGGAILGVATVVTALARQAPQTLLFPGLFLLGLGWSFGMVASSALLTESIHDDERVAVQGTADLTASVVSGTAALGAGFVFDVGSYQILSLIGTTAAGALLVMAFITLRRQPSAQESKPALAA